MPDKAFLKAHALSLIVLVVAFAVMLGWWIQSPLLVQLLPISAPMQFNTALCFAGCALGLILERPRPELSRALSLGVLLLATLTLLQYLSGSDFGVDHLFNEPFTSVRSSHPGRMAPNTAVAFALGSLAILLLRRADSARPMVRAASFYISAMVLFLGTAGLLTYILNPGPAAGWGHVTRMAVHTALLFVLLGAALLRHLRPTRSLIAWPALFAGLGSALTILLLWSLLESAEDQRVKKALAREVDGLQSAILVDLQRAQSAQATVLALLEALRSEPAQATIAHHLQPLLSGESRFALLYAEGTGEAYKTLAGDLPLPPAPRGILAMRSGELYVHPTSGRLQLWKASPMGQSPRWLLGLEYDIAETIHRQRTLGAAELLLNICSSEGNSLYSSVASDPGAFLQKAEREFEVAPGLSLWMEAYTTADFARTHSSRLPPWFLLLGLMFAATLSMTLLLLRRTRQHLAELHLEQQRLVEEVRTRKRAEKALEKERSALERSNQSLNEFAYVASHDLREPLRGIQTTAHMMLEMHGQAIPSEAKDRLEKVEDLAQRANQIISDLLLYSRLDNTRETHQDTDLEVVLQGVLKRIEPMLGTCQVQLQRQGEELPTADCAPKQISEVFTRLLTNAIQYGPCDGPQILVCNLSTTDQITIAIEDNGIGIAADKREKVFRIFTRLHHQDQYGGGTGAGLAIVRRILELHRGRVWIEDTQYFCQGTRILISWPRRQATEVERLSAGFG